MRENDLCLASALTKANGPTDELRVLILTAMYPTEENPAYGSFVRSQVEALKRAGVEVELLALTGLKKWKYVKGIFQLRHRLSRGSFDLVHAHFGYVGIVARMQWNVPVVVTFHGDDVLGTVNDHGKTTFASTLMAKACKFLSPWVDAAVVQSREMANTLKGNNAYIIPHEVDFEVFHPVEKEQARAVLGLDPRKKYLLFAANPGIPVKRFPLAKAVAEELDKRDPSVELRVAYKEPQDRLALLMNACDVLVFTSYQEGSPNIVKQAMACNLPIVATDVGDVQELIGSTQGCYVCKPEVSEFAKHITDILRRPQRTQGREQVRHLAGPLVAQRIIEVYEQVLKKRAVQGLNRVQTYPFFGK